MAKPTNTDGKINEKFLTYDRSLNVLLWDVPYRLLNNRIKNVYASLEIRFIKHRTSACISLLFHEENHVT